jgi:hypothetical protein
MFLHIMLVKIQRNQMLKKIISFFWYDVMLEYICAKKI